MMLCRASRGAEKGATGSSNNQRRREVGNKESFE